ncbi:hypothetical protein [Adhaeribacter radiodurans]|uniref:Uncharacterized protein n=1 Tax=Adhaeribacter radiodurans TaxID=2745197 RepID=A0A7L7L9Z6_9BACT|nr:hypothetical protein [Adhaeribacter radiodurans]QMU29666.1 hypothetical protein HUW48_17245 [Adhaeribacter radiodurans]
MLPITWILSIPVLGQERQYRDPLQPEKGHWQIQTNPAANTTVIQFFDGQNQQIYQEKMTGKYIRLTDRNIAKINQLFDQIASKTIVLAQVESEPLSSPAFRKLAFQNNKKQSWRENESSASPLNVAASLKVHAFQIYNTDKVELNFRNPDQKRVIIQVFTQDRYSIYKEITREIDYKRSFDFTAIGYGKYKLVVSPLKGRPRFMKQIEIKPGRQLL